MKSCPDIERLLELGPGHPPDVELEAHLRECPTCRSALRLIREIPAAMRPETAVPEAWIRRAAAVAAPGAAASRPRATPHVPAALAAVLLGSTTTAVTLAMAGSGGAGGPLPFLLLTGVGGALAGLVELHLERRGRAGAVGGAPRD